MSVSYSFNNKTETVSVKLAQTCMLVLIKHYLYVECELL